MEFSKKIRRRISTYAVYIIIGVVLTVFGFIRNIDNGSFTVGITMTVVGIIKMTQTLILTRNEEARHNMEIAEKDERNIMMMDKARSWAFAIYIIAAAVTILVLYCLDMEYVAQLISYSICALVFIYFVCYYIIKGKY